MAISVLGGLLYIVWCLWRILVYILGGLRHLWPHPRGAGSSSCPGPGLIPSTSACPDARNTAPGPGLPSSSTSAIPDVRKLALFDVFLNHWGPDVKMTFVAHLDAELRRFGRKPFLDAKSLVKGQHALNSIDEALTGVRVHVAVISPGYAKSKYCLNELCDMLASKKPVIPVFYKVEPENLRWPENEKGPFAEAFRHHLKRGRDQDVVKWREALKKVADISGFRFTDKDNERKLVEKVAAAVLNALPAPCPLPPARHPVGLKETSTHVVNMLCNMGGNVGVMSICGMGGIGKTTLAREVYNQEQSRFLKRCFLKDVKGARGTTIMDLQMRMVRDLLGEYATKTCWDYDRCFEMIQKQKILLVVDDISEIKQFYELIPDLKQLAPGSRVLITSRESDILNRIMADLPEAQRSLYLVPELNPTDSLELFIRCAFQRKTLDEVDADFHENVRKIVEACGGVPLALEVIGGFLADKKDQPKCWTEALSTLRNNEDIVNRLKISYDGLVNEADKCMFVDIACFMLGHPKDIVLEVENSVLYGSSSWDSLQRLIDKCLIKVDAEGQLYMHDLLRDMGRKIVVDRARGNVDMQTHVWDPLIATKILKRKHGLNEALIALSLVGMDPSKGCKAEAYTRMRQLKYVLLDNCPVDGNFSGWSEELRWLQWRYFPHEELPESLKLPNLVVLDLANSLHLSRVWTQNIEIECPCKELQVLILSGCTTLKELPESLGNLSNLETLRLDGCEALQTLPASLCQLTRLKKLYMNETALQELPQDFGKLCSLSQVDFSMCRSLVELPESFGNLSNLEKLGLTGCEVLQTLPASFCQLTGLKELYMRQTALQELPQDFGKLCSLRWVAFSMCRSLVELPESFGNLSNLETLELNECEALQTLPASFCQLMRLKELYMRQTALQELPQDFGKLCSLSQVDFSMCRSLVELPESFGNLSNLEKLGLTGCEVLQTVPASFCQLMRLQVLYMNETALQELPQDFGKLYSLRWVAFSMCRSLVELPESFGNLSNLETLDFDRCEALQTLPASLCQLTRLKKLYMNETALQELPQDFGKLCSLSQVDFSMCRSLVELPESFGNLSNLETLELNECEALQTLPASFCQLMRLKELYMRQTALQELPQDFGKLCSLSQVDFSMCRSLVELPESFGNLSNLEKLGLTGCEVLQTLPASFCQLTGLKELYMRQTALQELPQDFGKLCSLRWVAFSMCRSLVELPESFGNLSNLETLELNECEALQTLPASFCQLMRLKELYMRQTALQELPQDFGKLCSLSQVDFSMCRSLVELPESFGNLSNLEKLGLTGCEVLQTVPASFCQLMRLQVLYMNETALQELPQDFGKLYSLRWVAFSMCRSLVELPESFGNLSNLETLDFDRCEALQTLPASLCQLTRLKKLYMNETALQELPQDFGKLCSLSQVDFSMCRSLVELPESFGNLSNLETLELNECEALQTLPASFCQLMRLKELYMRQTALQELPQDFGKLCSLSQVDFSMCRSLVELPESFGNLSNLEKLGLNGCEALQTLPASFCQLTRLKELYMRQTALPEMPQDFGKLCSMTPRCFAKIVWNQAIRVCCSLFKGLELTTSLCQEFLFNIMAQWVRILAGKFGLLHRYKGRMKSKDLVTGSFLGQGCSGIFYETTLSGSQKCCLGRLARKDFPGVKGDVFGSEAVRLFELGDHPNIVKTLGWTVDSRSCSLVMEYVGDDLSSLMRRKKEMLRKKAKQGVIDISPAPFELNDAVDIALQIATGMEHLHDSGITHGDLKPNNVMIDWKEGRMLVKLADFGLLGTKRRTTLVSQRALCFRMIEWSAPELFENYFISMGEDIWTTSSTEDSDMSTSSSASDIDEKTMMQLADSYSFALTWAYILGGKMWDASLSPNELRKQISSSGLRPELPSGCPKELTDLISSCWDVNPKCRPTFHFIRHYLQEIVMERKEERDRWSEIEEYISDEEDVDLEDMDLEEVYIKDVGQEDVVHEDVVHKDVVHEDVDLENVKAFKRLQMHPKWGDINIPTLDEDEFMMSRKYG